MVSQLTWLRVRGQASRLYYYYSLDPCPRSLALVVLVPAAISTLMEALGLAVNGRWEWMEQYCICIKEARCSASRGGEGLSTYYTTFYHTATSTTPQQPIFSYYIPNLGTE